MISFHDKTFCNARECSKFNTCGRALTDELRGQAQVWWGGLNPPITYFADPKELKCYDPTSDSTKKHTGSASR